MNAKNNRLGESRLNNKGYLMKIVEYNNSQDIIVEFQDENKTRVHTKYCHFKNGNIKNQPLRFLQTTINNQGCLMKIIEYNNCDDIVVEFQDDYKYKKHATYDRFIKGQIWNPYLPTICEVGIVGDKYKTSINGKFTKEYVTWHNILVRCYDEKIKKNHQTYIKAKCCKDWLCFENFYEWLHRQPNFDKWLNGNSWAIDKDILVKGNKEYSPNTCCLVPQNINSLFTKRDLSRGQYPVGVYKKDNKFISQCQNPFDRTQKNLGYYDTSIEAFYAYKKYKEDLIKYIAKEEFGNGNITRQCYEAMMNYQVEITD